MARPARPIDAVRELARRHAHERGPLVPILHDVMAEHGYIADEDIPVIAEVLNLSRADVHGVVSFYHDFRRTPPPTQSVQICRGEACQAVGADQLYASARQSFSPTPGDSTNVEVREVFCLGNCALGPSGVINGRVVGRLTSERVTSLLQGRGVNS